KKPLLRVPLGEGLDIGRSAQEWTDCWRTGAIAMADDYYLAHGRSLSKTDMASLHSYVFINRLDPSVLQNWTIAFDRLVAGGVIKHVGQVQEPKEPQTPQRKDITELSTEDAKQRLVEDADAMLTEFIRPVWNEFINLLESSQRYLGTH